jgi:hypothetical protein
MESVHVFYVSDMYRTDCGKFASGKIKPSRDVYSISIN